MHVKQYVYKYPRPAVTVDVVVHSGKQNPQILLVRRKAAPFAGHWALPGGFVEIDEPLKAAAARELFEETGVSTRQLIQLHTFGAPGRDPRGRTISVVYLARVNAKNVKPAAGDDAAEVGWFSLNRPPSLAFDHKEILKAAREYLRDSHG